MSKCIKYEVSADVDITKEPKIEETQELKISNDFMNKKFGKQIPPDLIEIPSKYPCHGVVVNVFEEIPGVETIGLQEDEKMELRLYNGGACVYLPKRFFSTPLGPVHCHLKNKNLEKSLKTYLKDFEFKEIYLSPNLE